MPSFNQCDKKDDNPVIKWCLFSIKFHSWQYSRSRPQVDSALVLSPFQHQVPVLAPLWSPAVLYQPVISVFCSVPHQHQSMIWPCRAKSWARHSALVMHQSREIQQYRQWSHVVKRVLDDVFVMSDVHVTLDLDSFWCWVELAWSAVIGSQWVISFSHQSTILDLGMLFNKFHRSYWVILILIVFYVYIYFFNVLKCMIY